MIDVLTRQPRRPLQGVATTLAITALAFVGAVLLGTVVAVFRVSPIPPLRALGAVYVELFRNIPLLSLLILVAYGLPYVGLSPLAVHHGGGLAGAWSRPRSPARPFGPGSTGSRSARPRRPGRWG